MKEEGLKVFARACASCHGDRGQGGTNGGKSVGAINDPDFLALISDQALRRYVITGRPDLGMPDYADPKGRPEGFQPLTSRGRHERRGSPGRAGDKTGRVATERKLSHVALRQPDSIASRRRIRDAARSSLWLTYATGAVAAAVLLGLPFVGYLFGALRKHRVHWVGLGPPGQFPLNETRLATFQNPLGQPWDGMAAHMGVYVRNLGRDDKRQDRFLVFAMNCASPGLPRDLVPAVRSVHVSVPWRRLLRERRTGFGTAAARACSTASGGSATDNWKSRRPTCPRCRTPWTNRRKREDRR